MESDSDNQGHLCSHINVYLAIQQPQSPGLTFLFFSHCRMAAGAPAFTSWPHHVTREGKDFITLHFFRIFFRLLAKFLFYSVVHMKSSQSWFLPGEEDKPIFPEHLLPVVCTNWAPDTKDDGGEVWLLGEKPRISATPIQLEWGPSQNRCSMNTCWLDDGIFVPW